jgi:hypothetical protein
MVLRRHICISHVAHPLVYITGLLVPSMSMPILSIPNDYCRVKMRKETKVEDYMDFRKMS